HIDMLRSEQLFRTLDRKIFDDVHEFASAVVASAGISFGVLVGKHRSGRLEHGAIRKVFGSNQLESGRLAAFFILNSGMDIGIHFLERRMNSVHRYLVVDTKMQPTTHLTASPYRARAARHLTASPYRLGFALSRSRSARARAARHLTASPYRLGF